MVFWVNFNVAKTPLVVRVRELRGANFNDVGD